MKTTLFIPIFLFSFVLKSQVVHKEYLNQDHSGSVMLNSGTNGTELQYTFEYVSTDEQTEYNNKNTISKIHYKLHLKSGNEEWHFDLQIRDLLVTSYFEIDLDNSEDKTVVTAIYNKKNRWVKLKGVVEDTCRAENAKWGRLESIQDFNTLLSFIVSDLGENIVLNCYI